MTVIPAARAALAKNPAVFLASLAFINWFGYAAWSTLLNNFAVEQAGFGWFESGLTQTIREIPGFLAFTAIFWILWFREQSFAYVSLVILGFGIALTGYFPSLTGILITTFIMSVGFHYFETMNQSLQLQLLEKREAPKVMGRIASVGSMAQFLAYGGLGLCWWAGWRNFQQLYLAAGLICIALALAAVMMFGKFDGPVPQRKQIVLRRRYWLYYAITFMSGARRQLFMAFGGFLLVKRFGYSVTDTALMMTLTAAANVILAPLLGRLIARLGERTTIMAENVSLIIVFAGYALTNDWRVAGLLYVLDGVFFTFFIAQRTYFQKIADPADMAPTAAVSFTINHIAAVAIPVTFGLLALIDYKIIFWLGALIACASLALSFLIPRNPGPGYETVLVKRMKLQPAE